MLHFVYNFINIINQMAPYLLFGFLIAGILSQIIPTSWVQRHLSGKGYAPIVKSAMIGVPLPLCSCGVIPVMASFRKQGANVPAMLSFILSTPQTGVDSILATYALLGLTMAIYRPFIALITGLLGGIVYYWISKREVEQEANELNERIENSKNNEKHIVLSKEVLINKLIEVFHYGFITLPREIARPLVIGIIITSAITTFIPPGIITKFLGSNILQIFAAILVGIPIYVCATASIPIALSLVYLGASPGSALAFLIAGPATNFATIAVVKQLLGKKAVIVYLLTMVISALFFGITFDVLVDYFPFMKFSQVQTMPHIHETLFSPTKLISLIFFTLILILGILKIDPFQYLSRNKKELILEQPYMKIKVSGMTCSHCLQRVTSVLKSIPNVIDVNVSLDDGVAIIYGNPSFDEIDKALSEEGYPSKMIEENSSCNNSCN